MVSLRWETFTVVSLSLIDSGAPDSAVGFHGQAGWVKNVVCLVWLWLFIRSSRFCWWCEIISSSVQKIWDSKKDVKQTQFKFLRFFFPSSGRLFSPLHSSFPLFPGHTLGAPPGSEWECCRPCSRRARRGCTAAGCSGLNCVEWEKRRPARTNETQKCIPANFKERLERWKRGKKN